MEESCCKLVGIFIVSIKSYFLIWLILIYYFQGIPEQTDSKTCGYFVMRYMKEIVEDKNLEFATKVRMINCI